MNIDPPKVPRFLVLRDYKGDDLLVRDDNIIAIEGDRKLFQCTLVCKGDVRLLVTHKPQEIASMLGNPNVYETLPR